MKTLVIFGAITLLSSSAFAHDEVLGGSSEYYGSALKDHGSTTAPTTIPRSHDHGDNTMQNFTEHEHDKRVADVPGGDVDLDRTKHSHGDNTALDYTPHAHN